MSPKIFIRALLFCLICCGVAGVVISHRTAVAREVSSGFEVTLDRSFEGVRYTIVRLDPARLELHWRNMAGKPYGSFESLRKALLERGRQPLLLMNAGIFAVGGRPLGLHIEAGRELVRLNRATGYGNFYLKPNGVFFVQKSTGTVRASLLTTDRFAVSRPQSWLAVQSGPMLLVDGRINTQFAATSSSRLVRNGIGVDDQGRVVIAIVRRDQARYANFYEFARLFRAEGCRDALYLDGNLSALQIEPKSPIFSFISYGAFFAVTTPVAVTAR